MGHRYQAVGWNRQKRIYDGVMLGGLALYLAVSIASMTLVHPTATIETILIRAFGTAALLLLHVVLCIGPLTRLQPAFLPLLYNRRHLGVTTFVMGLAHAVLATIQFHALGDVNPLVSILISNPRVDSISQFPFQPLGLLALVILFLMAATSHDFWLANLTAPVWKGLHMLVYVAYAALIGHVTLGVLQSERNPALAAVLGAGLATVIALHLAAGVKERRRDRPVAATDGWVDVGTVDEIEEKCARVATVAGERVAVFKYDGKISCVSNVCQHQNGPLGEGRIIDGFVTCPWHGYQYCPDTGASPEPFTEKIPTFTAVVRDGRILVHPKPHPPGTRVEPAVFSE